MRGLVDDEAFDLMEHRRVRLIAVAAVDAARRDDADGRAFCAIMVRICTGLVCVRKTRREPSAFGWK